MAAVSAPSVVVQQRVEVTSNGDRLERDLNSIMRTTTVEDLAKKGGPLKTVKEKDLRELIRQSLLQLLASETSISGAEQERILDRVQGELKKKMTAHATEQAERLALATENQALQGRLAQFEIEHADRAGELGRLRALLAETQHEAAELRADLDRQALTVAPMTAAADVWVRAADDALFAGRQRREAARHGSDVGETLAAALQGHVETCRSLLAEYEANPPGVDAAGDILARIRVLLDLRVRDQQWITELQQRTTTIASERDAAHAAAEAELQHTIEVETRLEEVAEQLVAYEAGVAERDALIAGRDAALAEVDAILAETRMALATSEAARNERQPVLTLPDTERDGEVSELRDRLDDAVRRLEDAVRGRTRVEQDLATAAGARAAAEHRLSLIETQLAKADQRHREVQMQLGDQRKTTDLARLASVEAEALRAEVEGLKKLLHEREHVLATERDRAHADRDRHRADGAVRLEALKRVELALLAMREQLSERDRQLVERSDELAALQAAAAAPQQMIVTAGPDRSAECAALVQAAALSRAQAADFQASIADIERARRIAEAERDALRTHQANRVQLAQERDLLRLALSDAESRLTAREQELDAARRRPALTPAPAPVQASADTPSALHTALAPIHAELASLRVALQGMSQSPAPVPPVLMPATRHPVIPEPVAQAFHNTAPLVDQASEPQPPKTAPSAIQPTLPPTLPPTLQSTAPAKPTKRGAVARPAASACLDDDQRARFAYVSGSVPRLVVHGATWHHQSVSVTTAAADSRPLVVMQDGQPSVVYRDRSGALHRAGPSAHEVLLEEGSAVGDPAILLDPAHGRWLIAARNAAGAMGVHAMSDAGTKALTTCVAQGDPAWWSGGKDGVHRLVVPANDAQVAVLSETTTGWSDSVLVSFAPVVDSVAAVAVAGRGGEGVLAVRSASGVVAARRCRRDGTWEDPVVLDAAGAPAIGSLAAAQSDGEIVVAYRSDDGLLQLMLHRGAWSHLAFGANFRAPGAASDPQLLLHDNLIRCFYVGTDDHVHEVRNNSAGWHHYDLTLLAR